LGSYLGEDDPEGVSHLEGDDSAMAGVVYDGTTNPADMTEEERQRLNLPSIKAQHVQGNNITLNAYSAHSPTFNSPGTNASRSYPPNIDRGSASSNTSHTPGTSISSLPIGAGNPNSMYAQSTMTESPKPLSPSGLQGHDPATINRQRSPSLTAQFQQQHFGRPQSDRHTPPGSYSCLPIATWLDTETSSIAVPGFAAADAARYAASAAAIGQAGGATTQSAPGSANQQILAGGVEHPRTSSGPGQNGGSGDSSSNNIFATDQGIWAYIHSLEEQVRQLNDRVQAMEATERAQEEKITYLTNEVTTLRSQADAKTES